jgi:membrane-bound lytic murein transglycosylase B
MLLFGACSTHQPEIKKDTNLTKKTLLSLSRDKNLSTTTSQTSTPIQTPTLTSTFSSTSHSIPTPTSMVTPTPTPAFNSLTQSTKEVVPQEISQESYSALTGEFAGNWKLNNFIERMHNEHGFDYDYLYRLFSSAQNANVVIEPCDTEINGVTGDCTVAIKPRGAWEKYRDGVIYEANIQRGLAFWNKNKAALNRAYHEYGVLPEFIIGILGIETGFGKYFGKKRVLDVLTTKAMLSDRRADFYTKQLEKYLLMVREANLDASTLMGSNAGAMGYGQFIPSSYLMFAVDFNHDGVKDLWNAEDAIGSIANYFAQNGWQRNLREIAVRAKYRGNRFRRLKTGYKTKYSQYRLRKKYGIVPRKRLRYKGPVCLIKLPKHTYDELWFGTHNFRVITTYNHNSFYAMTVYLLGKKIKKRRYGK